MKPWKAPDMAMLMETSKSELNLADGETTYTVADALCAHSKLGALPTNARTAFFMVEAVMRSSALYSRYSWGMQLDEWTPMIVTRVVLKTTSTTMASRTFHAKSEGEWQHAYSML